jgi:DNA uptake protein ComE-like DNA-binding protein
MRLAGVCFAIVCVVSTLACNQRQSPEQLKEKTAQATAEMKQNAKAVAEGVREGWSRDKPLNINTATKDQLASLPGITDSEAEGIMVARPYDEPNDLVKRKVLSQAAYDKISDRIVAK